MKKAISFLLILAFVITLLPSLAGNLAVSASSDAVVYLNGNTGSDANSGKMANSAVATLGRAVQVANTYWDVDEVTIVVTGPTCLANARDYVLPENTTPITVTSSYGGANYGLLGANVSTYTSNISTIYFNGPFTFENITIITANTNSIFAMQYNDFTIGEGVNILPGGNSVSYYPILLVGCNTTSGVGYDKASSPKTFTNSVKVEVNSGTWAYIRGGDRDSHSTFNGEMLINIKGGKFLDPIASDDGYVKSGNTNGATGKCSYGPKAKIVINLEGGEMDTLVGSCYVGTNSGHTSSADITLNFYDGFKLTDKFGAVQANNAFFNGKVTVNLYGGDLTGLVASSLTNTTGGNGTVTVNYDPDNQSSAAAFKALKDVCVDDTGAIYGNLPDGDAPVLPEEDDDVLYQNDFSDPSTIADFKQYRGTWEIKNGKLWLTGFADGVTAIDTYAFILLNNTEKWENYVVEADIENVQTSTGILGRCDISLADSSTANSFAGYLGFVSNDAAKGAIGRSSATDYTEWAGNYSGSVLSAGTNIGSSVHLKMTFYGSDISLEITDLNSGALLYYFKVSTSEWAKGTAGFRVRFSYPDSGASSINTVSLDNFVVKAIDENYDEDFVSAGSCGANVSWKLLASGELVISGRGEMSDYNINGPTAPWYSLRNNITSVTVNSGVESIGAFSFYGCKNLTSVSLPEGLLMINEMAFYETAIVNIALPETLEYIASSGFQGCKVLKNIRIPASVVYIGDGAFYICYELEDITVDSKNKYYEAVDGVLYDKLDKVLLTYPSGKTGSSYTILPGTKRIAKEAFFFSWVQNVVFPASLTEISDYAFEYCSLGGALVLPEGLVTLGKGAFAGCSLITSVKLPSTLTNIGSSVFSSCKSITHFEVAEGNTAFVAVDGVLYTKNMKTLMGYPSKSTATTYVVPEGVTAINGRSFMYTKYLTSVKLPSTLKTIGDYAFYYSYELSEIQIPESVTSIGYYAFSYCSNLKSVTILPGTISLKAGLFENGNANLTIYGFENSTAKTFATSNNINFVPIDLKLHSASLTLYNNLAVNYKVKKAEFDAAGYTEPYLKIVMNGKTTIVSDYTELDGMYVFSFRNLAPFQINEEMEATLYAKLNGTERISDTVTYSIARYCYNQLGKSNDAKLCTLLVDLLNYGAEAQLYEGYNVDNLANANLTQAQIAMGTSENPELNDGLMFDGVAGDTAVWKAASIILKDNITVMLKFETADVSGMYIKVEMHGNEYRINNFTVDENGRYVAKFEGFNATHLRDQIKATIYDVNGNAVSNTLIYSVETYSARNVNKADLTGIINAMMKYGDSAAVYNNEQNK